MLLLLYISLVLFIPQIRGKNVLTSLQTNNTNHVNNSTLESQIKDSDITNVALNTEGGSVIPKSPPISLLKEDHSDLTDLDKEVGKTKGKSVVPRKGVQYDFEEESPSKLNHTKERIDSTISDTKIMNDKVNTAPVQPPTSTNSSTKLHQSSSAEGAKESTTRSSVPVIPKKPFVLSSEAISETDKRVEMEKAKTESSSKPVVSQLPSPGVKHMSETYSSHPDMIMPIVITMLVVPMFAVLGYMALRRGQEAWKNRHYKRMDFLLDGMYND